MGAVGYGTIVDSVLIRVIDVLGIILTDYLWQIVGNHLCRHLSSHPAVSWKQCFHVSWIVWATCKTWKIRNVNLFRVVWCFLLEYRATDWYVSLSCSLKPSLLRTVELRVFTGSLSVRIATRFIIFFNLRTVLKDGRYTWLDESVLVASSRLCHFLFQKFNDLIFWGKGRSVLFLFSDMF